MTRNTNAQIDQNSNHTHLSSLYICLPVCLSINPSIKLYFIIWTDKSHAVSFLTALTLQMAFDFRELPRLASCRN